MKLEKQKRMLDILQGRVPIEEVTAKEVTFLEQRVMEAVHRKVMQDSTKFTFSEHGTLQ